MRLLQRRPEPFSVRQGHLSALHVEIVRGCQLRCLGCPISGLLPKVERMSVELFDRCLQNIDVDSVEDLRLFNFGEPLLHHDLPGIFARIPRQSWSVKEVEISTNAQHVDWPQLAEAVRMGVLTRMVVSCDGDATAESYETLRPPSKWERLIEFLGRMRELRDRHAPGLDLMTRTIVPEWHLRGRWNDLLEPLGWRPEFRHFYYLPDSCQNATGRDLEKGLGVCFFVHDASLLYVDSDGTVVPCCAHPRAGAYGSLGDRTFSQILACQQRSRFVAQLTSSRESLSVCSRCEFGPADSLGPTRAALFPDRLP